jgi:hypothetical protein
MVPGAWICDGSRIFDKNGPLTWRGTPRWRLAELPLQHEGGAQ